MHRHTPRRLHGHWHTQAHTRHPCIDADTQTEVQRHSEGHSDTLRHRNMLMDTRTGTHINVQRHKHTQKYTQKIQLHTRKYSHVRVTSTCLFT